jgi:phosphoserine phosphatase RsbU/P
VLEVASDLPQVRLPRDHGLVGACARSRAILNVPDCYADPRFDRSVDERSGYRTRCSLTLPLVDHRDSLVGVMQLLNREGGVFERGHEALARALAAQCAVALSRAHLTAQALREERLRRELELARLVQTSALPRSLPAVPGYEMHAAFLPEAETGGDAYDLAWLGGRLHLLLADAAGHGIAPALAVMQLQSMLRAAWRLGSPLEAAFAQVNDQLADTLPDGHFITAFVGELDPAAHRLRFISGGQAPILLHRAAEARCEVFSAGSFPLGAMPLARSPVAMHTAFAPGDTLLLLSDGIYEQEDRIGQPYGRQRVQAVVAAATREGASAGALFQRLMADLHRFADGAPQQDDITAVVLRRLPTPP